jgi:hypothetical protein
MKDPAFPSTQYANGISPSGHSEGMTLRDYFAAKVMQGVVSNGLPLTSAYPLIAVRVYEMADAMLKARDGNS